ncbi:hypothetical protein [Ascidiimonas sp. W6]|uniref:hypothetical protein n=1 Tax=Ascidiimonas meishanensis TaxID=3128903 RepID=UPI0030ECC7F9
MENTNFNEVQRRGIEQFGLTRTQVQTRNFGRHTLEAIDHLQYSNPSLKGQEAFTLVGGLNRNQTDGLVNYGLTREKVQRPYYTENMLNLLDSLMQSDRSRFSNPSLTFDGPIFTSIRLLNQSNPEIGNQSLFDIVTNQLLEHQSRGLNLGLLPEQLGFSIQENQLIQIDDDNMASGRAVDVIVSLMRTEQMNAQQAFNVVQSLSIDQTSGITDFGLSLDQVQHPSFDRNEIIQEIANAIDNDEELGELEMPLNEVQQQFARQLMDEKIASAQQQQELSEQEVAYPSVAAMPSSSENNSSSDEERDLSALTTAMQIKEGISKQSSSKNEVKADKNSSKKKGPRPSGN